MVQCLLVFDLFFVVFFDAFVFCCMWPHLFWKRLQEFGGEWANKKQCEKKSYYNAALMYEERLIIFMNPLWQSITISMSFFFCSHFLVCLFYLLHLKLEHSLQELAHGFDSAADDKRTAQGQKRFAPFSLSIKTTSTVLNQKLIDSRLSLSELSISLMVFTFFRQCKVFW